MRWASSKNGTINRIPKTNKKLRTFSQLSIGRLLEEHSSNMTKEVLIMMISFKIFRQDWHFWKINLITRPKLPSQLTLLGILQLLWQFWLMLELKGFSLNVRTNIFCYKIKHNLSGKQSQPMVNIMVPYQLIFDGQFTDSRINSLTQAQDKIYVCQKKIILTICEERTSFWKEFCTVLISCDILVMISNNLMNIHIESLRALWRSFHQRGVIKL